MWPHKQQLINIRSVTKQNTTQGNYHFTSTLNTSLILNKRLVEHLENNKLIEDEQNGFRWHRSCAQHLFALQEIIQGRLNENKSLHLCFIDFSKAFDYLDRNLLFSRLSELGIREKLYHAIKQSYDVTLNAVRLNGETGHWFNTYNGVKQGDNLAPSQFSVYINSLLTELKKGKHRD